jgi:hypothetical protein
VRFDYFHVRRFAQLPESNRFRAVLCWYQCWYVGATLISKTEQNRLSLSQFDSISGTIIARISAKIYNQIRELRHIGAFQRAGSDFGARSVSRPPEGFIDLLVRVGLRAADVPEFRGRHPRKLPAAKRSSAPLVKASVPSRDLGVSPRRSCPAGVTELHDVPNEVKEGTI